MNIDLTPLFGLYYAGSSLFLPFQLITYMFMHSGFTHIFFNMFALWMFGMTMERAWGGKRFLVYYIICGIGAGLMQEACQVLGIISPFAATVGASGAVYGILLAFGMTFPEERLFIIPIPFPIKAKYFVCLYAAIELFEGVGGSDGVAHFAHLGGMLFGLMLILYWRSRTSAARNYTSTTFSSSNRWSRTSSAPKMTITYTDPNYEDHAYNQRRREQNEEIDRILDKVRTGGYENLTEAEKKTLFDASKR